MTERAIERAARLHRRIATMAQPVSISDLCDEFEITARQLCEAFAFLVAAGMVEISRPAPGVRYIHLGD